jgi:hypothetical protein
MNKRKADKMRQMHRFKKIKNQNATQSKPYYTGSTKAKTL